jgi:hypothetical protein
LLDVARAAEQKRKKAKTNKGAPYHPTVTGKPTENELPVIDKDSRRIRHEFLDNKWLEARETDENDDTKLRI